MGIIHKTHLSLWLHHIEDVRYKRSLINQLTGDGKVFIQAATEVKGQTVALGTTSIRTRERRGARLKFSFREAA